MVEKKVKRVYWRSVKTISGSVWGHWHDIFFCSTHEQYLVTTAVMFSLLLAENIIIKYFQSPPPVLTVHRVLVRYLLPTHFVSLMQLIHFHLPNCESPLVAHLEIHNQEADGLCWWPRCERDISSAAFHEKTVWIPKLLVRSPLAIFFISLANIQYS